MSSELRQELLDLRATISRIAAERIAPRAAEVDRTGEYPHDIHAMLADNDIFALPFAPEYGGTGTGTLTHLQAVEELSWADATVGLILSVLVTAYLIYALIAPEKL